MAENLRIDHVIFGTSDIDGAAREIEERYGLASVEGGKHEGRGTGNRIVPLGSAYLELMGVVDAEQAAAHPFGQWFTQQVSGGDRFLMWCVGTDDIEAVASRLGLGVEEWTRTARDGTVLSWRLAGLEVSNEHPEIPFFIQWTVPDALHPSHARADHRVVPTGFASVVLTGDEVRVRKWIGGSGLPISFEPGTNGVQGVAIATNSGVVDLTRHRAS